MSNPNSRPDLNAVLNALKNFQRDTVDYVFQRLFVGPDGQRRFLIADEVGLGKTLVARGLIAKAIDHLWDTKDRLDVVYICSNAGIARQNINRLKTGDDDFEIASRITLLPVTIRDLNQRKLNFISFTPGTSFDLKSSLGLMNERALLYLLLVRAWRIKGMAPFNVLQGNAEPENFRRFVDQFAEENKIDETLADDFARDVARRDADAGKAGHDTLRSRFEKLCEQFGRIRQHIPWEETCARRDFVGELRGILASTCLTALKPDLVILDEFQRFRHLLDGTDQASDLAQSFFSTPDVRLILLSATPYKMLTLQSEREEGEDHYQDFVSTISFLQNNHFATDQLKALLKDYGQEILRLKTNPAGTGKLRRIGRLIEESLRKVMCRTERLAVSQDHDGMLKVIHSDQLHLDPAEVEAYLHLQKIGRLLNQDDLVEYWKSAPYLLNFMEGYQIKDAFRDALESDAARPLANALKSGKGLLLEPDGVAAYALIDSQNARLRQLQADMVDQGSWKLLWIPPALPYYQFGGPFAEPGLKNLTKRLVFSSWRVVPRAVASLLSYEVERRICTAFEDRPQNTQEARQRSGRLLSFARGTERLTGMPVLGLMYPSVFLARQFDPLEEYLAAPDRTMPLDSATVLKSIQDRLQTRVQTLCAGYPETGREDEKWYWAAPLYFDCEDDPERTKKWWNQDDLVAKWSGVSSEQEDNEVDESDEEEEENSAWAEHVEEAKSFINDPPSFHQKLGRPPADLARVLALLAIGGPAIAAFRSLHRTACNNADSESDEVDRALRNSAAKVGWAFIRLFNFPEATMIIRGLNRAEPYWQRVLEYCIDGCFQAMLDEYHHVLRESLGLIDKPAMENISAIAHATVEAVSLRTTTLSLDYIRTGSSGVLANRNGPGMRIYFAVRFGDEKSEEEKSLVRSGQVRNAFNSPFWPFVLATTSVGQEGLDFHHYCHAVVHWNLPSNPVDLEQREGRVHRFKGHAIRKNLADGHAATLILKSEQDPWKQMFCDAKQPQGTSDLVPFWILPGAAKIQRHVPAMPLSRDHYRLEALRKSLAIYRMVLGQIRQDDLIAFLLAHFPESEMANIANDLKIDLAPRKEIQPAVP